MVQTLWEISVVWKFLKKKKNLAKLNILLPCNPLMAFLGIYSRDMKTRLA